jgi:predicted acylesterase/phospholipase RssA
MKDTIRHIVISGGGETGFTFCGILTESCRQGLWDVNNIQTIHGTSIGAMMMLSICFAKKLGWESLNDYWELRPWNQLFDFGIERIIDSFEKIGILDIRVVEKTLHPLLFACDLSPDITLEEFYHAVEIEPHFYSTNLDKFELVDISYKTHPTWKLTEAVYCSCSLPILFSPHKKDGYTYLDGAVIGNYPLSQCLKMGALPNEIFGIQKIESLEPTADPNNPTKELKFANMPDYLFTIFAKLLEKVSLDCPYIPYQINVPSEYTNIYEIYKITHDYEIRKKAIERGIEIAREFCERILQNEDISHNRDVSCQTDDLLDTNLS